MKNKRRNKKIRRFVLLLVVIIIIIIVCKQVKKKNDEKRAEKARVEALKNQSTEYYEGKAFPSGLGKVKYEYEKAGGRLSQDELYESLYSFSNYLSSLYDNYRNKTDENLEVYYNSSEDIVLKNIGIANKDNFLNIVNTLKELKLSNGLGKYKSSKIDTQTIKIENGYCVFDTTICYEYLEEGITFRTYFYLNKTATKKSGHVYFEVK